MATIKQTAIALAINTIVEKQELVGAARSALACSQLDLIKLAVEAGDAFEEQTVAAYKAHSWKMRLAEDHKHYKAFKDFTTTAPMQVMEAVSRCRQVIKNGIGIDALAECKTMADMKSICAASGKADPKAATEKTPVMALAEREATAATRVAKAAAKLAASKTGKAKATATRKANGLAGLADVSVCNTLIINSKLAEALSKIPSEDRSDAIEYLIETLAEYVKVEKGA